MLNVYHPTPPATELALPPPAVSAHLAVPADAIYSPPSIAVDMVAAFLAGRKPTTLRAYAQDLEDFASFLGHSTPGPAVELLLAGAVGSANALVLGYKASLLDRGLSPATVARRLAALRSLVKLARQLGRVNWSLEISGPKASAYRDTSGPGRAGWQAMLARAKAEATTPKGRRDLALVRVLHDVALRRAEAVGLDVEHLDLERGTILVQGKGRGERSPITLPPATRSTLADWLAVHPDPRPESPLFTRLDRAAGDDPAGRLTGDGVYKIVAALGKTAGVISGARPHGLRHQGVTRALDVTGGDVRAVRKFSRHAKLDTLMVYDDNRADLAGDVARQVADDA
jgi:integrase/recombinase XerC